MDMNIRKSRFFEIMKKLHVLFFSKIECERTYKSVFGNKPNLSNPIDWVEKIYWLQLHTDTSLWTICADKFRMREFVSSCGYKPMLPESLGVWNNACDINFELLPNKFVIKTNNATETCIVVRDKQNINYEEVRAQLNDWLKIRYGFDGCQFHYLGIKPCIVAEELLEADDLQNKISPKSLIDYKFFCCSGNPECVWIAYNRNHQTGVDMSIYDMNWNKHPEWLSNMPHYNYSDIDIPKPSCFNDMVEACKSLAANFPEVRIDFYVIGDKPYIGELTFTSGYGFFTPEFYKFLGSKIDVTKVSKDSLAYFKRLKYITLI